ncbi:hypothetical protein [Nocardia suismassiliense]|uniref:hypothetical protein n=1 Tax=Nocardia suismassiliense TaxID=2077092 RepID=UPI000D1F46C7|nr:hypothetical protein [Nocardia suismassiliense]
MRIRPTLIAAGAAAIGAAITVTTAGTAAAVVPIGSPQDGIIAGVGLNHPETQAVAGSPLPGLLGIGLLAPLITVHVDENSGLPRAANGQVLADMNTIFNDAAGAPNGRIAIAIVDPARFGGHSILVAEFL